MAKKKKTDEIQPYAVKMENGSSIEGDAPTEDVGRGDCSKYIFFENPIGGCKPAQAPAEAPKE